MEREVGPFRDGLLAGLPGRVEIVANLAHYPPAVHEVIAVEPEPYLRARADESVGGASVPVRLDDAGAATRAQAGRSTPVP
jgi:hypothetical protein